MKRFRGVKNAYGTAKKGFFKQAMISLAMFFILMFAFLYAIGKTDSLSTEEEKRLLAEAVDKGVMQCYVTEGRYPESIQYLEENYGIVYDKEVYRIDYRVYGSNMKPEIDIIELGD